jgi:parvulin-like peptidyl-prolyl isomerase
MRVQLEYMNIRAWALLTVFATAVTPALSSAEILEQIVVKVNGDIVTKTEFEQRQVAALRTRNQQQGGGNLQGDALRQAIAEITPRLILEAVDELLLLQRGKELGFKMTDQQYQTIVEQIRKENRLESEEAFQAALKQEGMTPADLRRNLERQVIISNVQRQEVMQKVARSTMSGGASWTARISPRSRRSSRRHLPALTAASSVRSRGRSSPPRWSSSCRG